MRFIPANKLVPKTDSIPGYRHFLTPLRKLIFDYDPLSVAQTGMRAYLNARLVALARANPDVEVVVRQTKRSKAAVVRGYYITGRDKVICVDRLDAQVVAQKVDILLNASGNKIKHLKNLQLEAPPGAESARGIWSAVHDQAKAGGGYRI